MSNPKDSNSNAQQPPANEVPSTTTSDVANASAAIVKLISGFPPAMQLRALTSAAAVLGVDKEQRGGTRGNTQQGARTGGNNQRSNTR